MSCLLNEPGDSAKTSSVLRSGGKVVVSSAQWGVWTWYGAALSFLDRNLAYAELFVSALCEYCERGGSLNGPVSQAAEVPGSRERE